MKWHADDIQYLTRVVTAGRISQALELVSRYPGLPSDACADILRLVEQWKPSTPALQTDKEKLLRKLQPKVSCSHQQQPLFALVGAV